VPPADPGRPGLRVATWNVHGGAGRARAARPARLGRCADLLRRHAPDLVALQEVDTRGWNAADGADAFALLADAVGAHRVEARSIVAADGDYGQMLVSRWPLAEPRIHDISVDRCEPRRIVEATLFAPFGPVRVLATHLGLGSEEHRRQARHLARLVAERPPWPTLVLGDFNDWRPWQRLDRLLAGLRLEATRHRTFPACLPLLPHDRVWCCDGLVIAGSRTDPAGRHLSDHLPLLADIRPRCHA